MKDASANDIDNVVNNAKLMQNVQNFLLASMFTCLLCLSNALWQSTVGIAIFMNDYYGVEPGTIKSNLPNSIYYLSFIVVSPLAFWCKKLIPSLITSLLLTLIGIIIRITLYVPYANANTNANSMLECFSQIFSSVSGINGQIIGNALIAAAQPFMFGCITTTTNECISNKNKATYLGMCTMSFSLGIALGYLLSIYKIESAEDFEKEFRMINCIYLGITCFLILIKIIILHLRYKIIRQQCNMGALANSHTTKAIITIKTGAGVDVTFRKIFDNWKFNNNSSNLIQMLATINANTDTSKKVNGICSKCKCNNIIYAKFCVIVYTVIVAVSYIISNYLENILISKNLSHNVIFVISCLYLLPGLLFPPLIGILLDKTGKWKEITTIIVFIQAISQILFLFSSSEIALYFWSALNGITTISSFSVLLSLISELIYPQSDKNYNNVMNLLSVLLTFIIMIIPFTTEQYPILYTTLTSLTLFIVTVYCISTFMVKNVTFVRLDR